MLESLKRFWSSLYVEGKWKFQRIGKNLYKVFIDSSDHSIAMTGSDVETQLHIPFPHKLLRIHLYHTDSSDAASTNSLSVVFQRSVATVGTLGKFVDELWNESGITVSKKIKVFGDIYEFGECVHTLILNTNNTDKIFPLIYVEEI